jgi:transposase InsO family protein
MGRTLQFESHRCELPFIQQMEHATGDVLEIWDQPIQLTLSYENVHGKRVTVQYVPDFFLCRNDCAELVECKTEEDLVRLAEQQPNRYRRGDDGAWHSPPMDELAKELGVRFTLRSSASINRVYIRNIEFLEDYMRMNAPLVAADALLFILTLLRRRRGISLTELLDEVLGQEKIKVESDDIYLLIVRGDIYVDLFAAPLAVRERVQVFENAELAEAYAPLGGVALVPRAEYAAASEGARLLWDGKPWRIANIGAGKLWLIGEATDIALTHARFDEYLASGTIELLDPAPECDPESEGRALLDSATPKARAEAERRFEMIKPYLDGEKTVYGAKKERTKRRYISAYKDALAHYGNGQVGLLPDWSADGKSVKRLPDEVYRIMDERIANDYETLVQKGARVVHGAVLNDCEARDIPEKQRPSYVTFCRRVNLRPRAEQTRKRKGKKAAYQHETHIYWLEKDTPPLGDRPFQIAHADCTELDVEMVCPITGENMGRPWAAFLVDAYTRLLLAMIVTFDEPSYRTTMMLLRECARRHNRLPQTLIVDGGKEFDNIYLRRLSAPLQMTIKFRPGAQPRHGSVGERLFGTANNELVHNLQGNTQIMTEIRKVTKKESPKTQAAWTLGPFTEWFTAWGYEVYNKRRHWTLKQSPIEALARSLELTGQRRRRITYDENFRILTMPTTRKRTAKNMVDRGVKINSIYYWNAALRERALEGKQLEVRYDPFNISIAYVWIRGRWVRCTSEYFAIFEYCTERQLKIVSHELRQRNKNFARSLPLTAKNLADFISRAEEVQRGQAEMRLFNQRSKDREVRPIFHVINGGAPLQVPADPAEASDTDAAVGSVEESREASPFAIVSVGNLALLGDLN